MALTDRLGGDSSEGANDALSSHIIIAALNLETRGHFTRTQIENALALRDDPGGDKSDYNAVQTWMAAGELPASQREAAQQVRRAIVEDVTTGVELGYLSKAQARTVLTNEGVTF